MVQYEKHGKLDTKNEKSNKVLTPILAQVAQVCSCSFSIAALPVIRVPCVWCDGLLTGRTLRPVAAGAGGLFLALGAAPRRGGGLAALRAGGAGHMVWLPAKTSALHQARDCRRHPQLERR